MSQSAPLPSRKSKKKQIANRSEAATQTALQIERFYSQQILTGKLKPGTRIPPNNQLTQIWSTSNATVQRALAKLSSEGLIERQQGRGTFVRDNVEKSCIGVFLGPDLAIDIMGFFHSLVAHIRDLVETEYCSLRIYDGLTKWRTPIPESLAKTYRNGLKANNSINAFKLDARHHTFNGYIYIGTSKIAEDTAVYNLTPRVAFYDENLGDDVILDSVGFLNETLLQLTSRGFTRIAYMQVYGRNAPSSADFLSPEACHSIARNFPLKTFEFWNFPLDYFKESCGDQLLRDGYLEAKIRSGLPEVIIISDDVIARAVIFNCVRRGIRISEDLHVCVRCNDTLDLYYGVPIFRYELPVRTIAMQLTDLLKKRMTNEPTPEVPIKVTGHFRDLARET